MDKLNEIIQDSLESLTDKKSYTRDMNSEFKEVSKTANIDPAVLRRVKDYSYYYGRGWEAGSPLVLDKDEKFKDRVSPTFRKLLMIIDDLAQAGHLELLDEYTKALSNYGIHLTFENYMPETKNTNQELVDNAITHGKFAQEHICTLSDKIKEEDSEEALAEGFGPKKEYTKLINLAYSKSKGKDIEDKCQDALADLVKAENSYSTVKNM